jgi:hypothetical protein
MTTLGIVLLGFGVFFLRSAYHKETTTSPAVGIGIVLTVAGLWILAVNVKSAEAAQEPPTPETWVVIQKEVLVHAAQLIQAQGAEIERLRAALVKASAPKECI